MAQRRHRMAGLIGLVAMLLSAAFVQVSPRAEARAGTEHPASATVTTITDVVYRTVGTLNIKLDVYMPGKPGLYPGVVYVHGGGWGPVVEEPAAGG